MHSYILSQATGKKTLFFFISANAVYIYMLAVSIPHLVGLANGMALPDMLPTGYTLSYLLQLFDALGETGRTYYLHYQLLADTFYPILFGICYSLVWVYFLKKIKRETSFLFWIALLPPFAALFDYLENTGIFIMLNDFPQMDESTVLFTSIFTIAKSMLTTIYFVALIILLIFVAYTFLKQRSLNKHQA